MWSKTSNVIPPLEASALNGLFFLPYCFQSMLFQALNLLSPYQHSSPLSLYYEDGRRLQTSRFPFNLELLASLLDSLSIAEPRLRSSFLRNGSSASPTPHRCDPLLVSPLLHFFLCFSGDYRSCLLLYSPGHRPTSQIYRVFIPLSPSAPSSLFNKACFPPSTSFHFYSLPMIFSRNCFICFHSS